jgi:hypothetical protein
MSNGRYSASVDQLSQDLLRSAARRRDQPSTRSPALRYWNLAQQRHYRRSAPCRRAMPVSGDCAARHGPHTRRKRPVFDLGRPTPVRDGLSAGGNRIRTIGPAPAKGSAFGDGGTKEQQPRPARGVPYHVPTEAPPHTPPKFAPEPAPFRLAAVALSATGTGGACHGRVCADNWPFTGPSVE